MTRVRRWAAIVGRTLLILILIWAILRVVGIELARINPDDFARWRPAAWLLVLASTALLAVYLGHALLWRRIVADLAGGRPSIRATWRIYFLANLGRYVPGKVWQIAGMAYLARQAGLPVVGAAGAAAIGQATFLLTGAVFVTVALPAWAGPLPAVVAATIVSTLAGSLFWLALTPQGRRLRDWAGERLGQPGRDALEMAGRIRPRQALFWAAGYAVSWLVLGAAFAAFTIAFVPEAVLASRHLAGTVAAAYLVGYAAVFAPGGIGVREAVMTVLLDQVMPTSAAILVAVTSRLWFTLVELLPVAALPLLRRAHAGGEGGADS